MKKEVKVRRAKPAVTVEDLYTREELNAILQVCTKPQDKAMIEVLYESACRVGELVSMTFENIEFMTDSVVAAIVSGKTGTRTASLFESVPALRNWMNHPIKKGLLWIKYGKPYTRITTTAVYY